MKLKFAILLITAFIFGMLSTFALVNTLQQDRPVTYTTNYVIANEDTVKEDSESHIITRILGLSNEERPSPYDRVPESKILVEKDKIVINVPNAQWSKFTDTNSMDPVIDEGANAIQIVPTDRSQIHVGDIVSYESDYAEGIIIHRVIEIGYDEKGWYCIMKGDNNPNNDPGKVRFSQIRRVVIAIIY
jgi:hypothetical protein